MTSSTPVLIADAVSLRHGTTPAVDEVSLTLHAGEWVAIVGPNGAGKSSLLSLLAGLRSPDRGQVRLCGRAHSDWSPRERAMRLTWLAQQTEAEGEISVLDVVRLSRLPRQGLFGAPQAADEAIVAAALAETETTRFAARRLRDLSGGERQRVLLARALAAEAEVLLLDEPTAHLDPPHQRLLLRGLRARARQGVAVVSVMHDLTLALAADRLFVMQAGRLRAEGPPDDPQLRAMLEQVFDGAIRIEALRSAVPPRWVAVPSL